MAEGGRKSRFKRMHEENLAKENKRIENSSTLTDELIKNTTNPAKNETEDENRPSESMASEASKSEEKVNEGEVKPDANLEFENPVSIKTDIEELATIKESTTQETYADYDNFIYDKNGNIKLKTDGTPARKPGRKKIKDGSYIKLSISMPKDMYDAVHDYLSLYRENMTEYVLSLVAKDVNENYENNMNKIEASKADPTRITIKRRTV